MSLTIECVADLKCEVGEGCFWDEKEQALFFVDIPPGVLYRLRDGRLDQWTFGEPLGCLALDRAGNAILALKSGLWRYDLTSGRKIFIVHPEADRPGNRFNDGALDRRGRFWIGSMKLAGPPERTGAFYRLDTDLAITRHFDETFTTNGLAFSPDGAIMYFSDSNPEVRTIWACDYNQNTGYPSNRRVFFDTRRVAGRPDGGTVDAEGCYWMAGVGGWQLLRLRPDGSIDRVVDMPIEKPSRPWFGGPDLDVLYVTSLRAGLTPGTEARQPQAGGLFAVRGLGVKGLAQPRFGG